MNIIIEISKANRRNKPIYINNNPMTGTYKRFHEGDFKCSEYEIKAMISLTLAGLLMFGEEKDIVLILPNYFLDYREIKDSINTERWSNRITSWDDNWTGNLWDFFEKIVNRLTADLEIPFELDNNLMRIEDTIIHKCIREALSNSLIHTQYDESGSIVIEKGENYFKFANPGNMRIPVAEAFKGGQSDPRNPLLHKMFSYLGYGERAGSGLSMINNVWKEKGWIIPKIEETFNPNRTTLILYTKENNGNYTNNYTKNYTKNYTNYLDNINTTQKKIIEIIKENPTITTKELAKEIENITLSGIKWNLKKLKDNKIISREGNSRKGRWIIL